MINLDDLRFFDALAHAPTLAAASRALGVTPPALTVRLRKIEATMKTRLVTRGNRSMALTDAGRRLVEESSVVLRQIEGIAERISLAALSLEGPLRVAAPFGFGRRHVASLLQAFCARHPGVVATLTLAENPLRHPQGSDLVIHIGKLRDSSWVATKLGSNERWLCASPGYVKAFGQPRHPEDLSAHRCLCLRENDEDNSMWYLRRGRAAARSVRVTPTMLTNDGEVLCQWAEGSHGIILRSQWDVAPRVAAGSLVRILPDWMGEAADIFALAPERHGQTARSQAFLNFAKERLRREWP
jgi:DNA-binding transcriptional LysR family regulator